MGKTRALKSHRRSDYKLPIAQNYVAEAGNYAALLQISGNHASLNMWKGNQSVKTEVRPLEDEVKNSINPYLIQKELSDAVKKAKEDKTYMNSSVLDKIIASYSQNRDDGLKELMGKDSEDNEPSIIRLNDVLKDRRTFEEGGPEYGSEPPNEPGIFPDRTLTFAVAGRHPYAFIGTVAPEPAREGSKQDKSYHGKKAKNVRFNPQPIPGSRQIAAQATAKVAYVGPGAQGAPVKKAS